MKSLRYSQAMQDHLLRGGPAPVTDAALRVALHGDDPASDGDQAAHEIPALARAAIDRRPDAWNQDGARYTNAVAVRFARAGAHDGKRVARFWSLGDAEGNVLISGKLQEEQEVVAGLVLEFKPGTLVSEEF